MTTARHRGLTGQAANVAVDSAYRVLRLPTCRRTGASTEPGTAWCAELTGASAFIQDRLP